MRLRRTPPRPPPSPIPARPARTMGQGAGIPYRRQSEQGVVVEQTARKPPLGCFSFCPQILSVGPDDAPGWCARARTHAGRRYHRAVQSGGYREPGCVGLVCWPRLVGVRILILTSSLCFGCRAPPRLDLPAIPAGAALRFITTRSCRSSFASF